MGGVIADRMDRRKLLLMSQVIQMASALTLAFLIGTHRIQIWEILLSRSSSGARRPSAARPIPRWCRVSSRKKTCRMRSR